MTQKSWKIPGSGNNDLSQIRKGEGGGGSKLLNTPFGTPSTWLWELLDRKNFP